MVMTRSQTSKLSAGSAGPSTADSAATADSDASGSLFTLRVGPRDESGQMTYTCDIPTTQAQVDAIEAKFTELARTLPQYPHSAQEDDDPDTLNVVLALMKAARLAVTREGSKLHYSNEEETLKRKAVMNNRRNFEEPTMDGQIFYAMMLDNCNGPPW